METEMNSGCRMVDCMVCFTPNCDILRRARERRRYSFERPAPGADEMADREELAREWAEQTWTVGEMKAREGEISMLKQEVEALAAERDGLAADRDRWRRYAGMLRDRLAAAQDAVRKWHHHAYCQNDYNGRVGEELRGLAAERDGLNRQLDHADGRIIDLTSCVDALRQQLDESDHQLALLKADRDVARRQLASSRQAYIRASEKLAECMPKLAECRAAQERAEAEAGVMRKTLEEIAASTAGDDEPGDRSPRRAGWECVQVARTALASDTGEKAAAVLAAATAHVHWLWSYHGRHYEGGMPDERRLVAAVDAREKGEAECG